MQALEADLKKGWNFWINVIRLIKAFKSKNGISEEYYAEFIGASSFLQGVFRRNSLI